MVMTPVELGLGLALCAEDTTFLSLNYTREVGLPSILFS